VSAPAIAPGMAESTKSGRESATDVATRVLAPLWGASAGWWILLAIAAAGTLLLGVGVVYSVAVGTGVWGTNIPVAWAFPIINFVWWIGLGHAGTFISAFLLLLDQRWRSAVSRLAESMTLFALVNASMFPVLHLGRPWFLYWLLPYPATMGVWPNFKSSLTWDVAAIFTYFTVSLLFWYLGLLPDLAAARARAPGRRQRLIYGVLALGWTGSGTEWRRRRSALTIIAALAAPLVVSVHSVVSLDFAIAQLPGWHATLFPPYFVVGAVFSGLALVLVLAVLVRGAYRLHDVITDAHLDRLAKLVLATGLLLAYCYVLELFTVWYSGDPYERAQYFEYRWRGPLAVVYWPMMALNVLTPQLFWVARLRRSGPVLVGAGCAILIGMWLERFIIIIASLSRDFLPSSWGAYAPSWVDLSILAGSVGLFGLFFLLFVRFVPLAAVTEIQAERFLRVERRT
jgi:Ni/Fe-hydrogenase subunit HybB-like protein